MKLIIDSRALDLYPLGKPGFHGGTESYVIELARGLAGKGHTVHIVTNDLDTDEQRGEREFWWPPTNFPTRADAVIMVPSVEKVEPYSADLLIAATNGLGHYLGEPGDLSAIDAFPVFSQTHADLLHKTQGVPLDKCFLTGLGVDLTDYMDRHDTGEREDPEAPRYWYWPTTVEKVPGRIMVGNDPQRGLWHVLDIFDKLKLLVPHATLHVTYDCQKVFDSMRWQASHMSTMLLECEQRLVATEGVDALGALSRQDLIREQLECQVHVWPSDPPNVGSQIWGGITQMECAAAGAALVVSDIEAMPETFAGTALILPVPGTFDPAAERRVDAQDWAEQIAEIMLNPEQWAEMSRKSRALAEKHTWAACIDRWEAMLQALSAKVAVPA